MAICTNCGKEFEAKRSDALYCSAKCRKAANRTLSVTPEQLSVTEDVTDKPINVTLKNGKLDADIPEFESDLPDYVPFPVVNRYELEHEYRAVIDRLINHTLDELKALGVWIPCWRLHAEVD